MHRIPIDENLKKGARIRLEGEEIKRLRKVLRLKVGDRVALFNPDGLEARAEIRDVFSGAMEFHVVDATDVQRESPLKVRFAQALPKGDRLDWIVQKATELGVHEIVLLNTERCVVRWSDDRAESRVARLWKIAEEAARQSGRTAIPELIGPIGIDGLKNLAVDRTALKLVLWEEETRHGLRSVTQSIETLVNEVWIAVGPEGGFERKEVDTLVEAGFSAIKLGPRILRTETAGLTIVSILQYAYGDLG